jgi:anti-sigma regulatory factor (Ser/Thr protein kinase)
MRSLKNREQHDDLTWALWEVPPPMPLAPEPEPTLVHEAGLRMGLVLQFEMDPRIHQVRDLVPSILGLLGFKGVPAQALQKLGMLLTEALDNAVDHGLLAMDSSMKSRGFEIYESRRRSALAEFKGGMARCRLSLQYGVEDPPALHRIEIEVSDDGPGFDWGSIVRSGTMDLLAPYGRGIPIMKALAPDFRFNEVGNTVTFSVAC